MNGDLLSRIAETLFWTGRYIERADDTARLVDVYLHRMLGDPVTGSAGVAGALCTHRATRTTVPNFSRRQLPGNFVTFSQRGALLDPFVVLEPETPSSLPKPTHCCHSLCATATTCASLGNSRALRLP